MAETRLAQAVAALGRALERAGVRHMLIGGIAVIAHGVRRLTDDVDAAVWSPGVDVDTLLDELKRAGIFPRIKNAEAFAARTQVLLLRHERSEIEIDLSLASLPFEDAAMDRTSKMTVGRTKVRVAAPADLIVYKAIAGRERDRSDVERLLTLYWRELDLAQVRRTVRKLSDALDRPEILEDLEALISRARPGRTTARRTKAPGRTKR